MQGVWTREIFWNLGSDKKIVVYLLAFMAMVILAYGLYRRYFLWRKVSRTQEPISFNQWGKRIGAIFIDGLLQRRVLREYYPGAMHAFILWGFIVLFLGTLTVAIQEDFTVPFMGTVFLKGLFYFCYKLILNVAGLLAVIGVLMALIRRYGVRPERLSQSFENGIILLWILIVLVTGFILEGLRIDHLRNDWEVFSIGGWVLSKVISALSLDPGSILLLHRGFWWVHLFAALGLIASIPFSRLIHLVTSPANVFNRATTSQATVLPIKRFEISQSFGVSEVSDFSGSQIFDLDACTQCGRCQDNCPAHLSGKPLSPKKAIEALKAEWLERGNSLRKQERSGARRSEGAKSNGQGLLEEDVIWSCTFCMACFESCPVYISCFDKIIDLRRNHVLMKSQFFPEIAAFFKTVETFGDTYGKGRAYRENWTGGMDMPKLLPGSQTDLLFWVGCQGAYHDRSSLIASSLAGVLKQAGLDFAILGKEENCCGDPVRRIGDEYLFQKIAKRNIGLLRGLHFKRILTYCPHCFNMLKNEYPQLGGDFKVVHYTELLGDLIRGGNLKIQREMERKVAYHDPCYLARANNIHEVPREILRSIPGIALLESHHSKRQTFCCGAGGGHMWMREIRGKKINEVRVKELSEIQPDIIATSCPYCLVMFEDGVKSLGVEGIRCLDLIEMIREAL